MSDTFDDEDDYPDDDSAADGPEHLTSDASDLADDGDEFATIDLSLSGSSEPAMDLDALDDLAVDLGTQRLGTLAPRHRRELEAFLAGSSRAFLVHKGSQQADHLGTLIGEARRAVSGRISIGTVARAPQQKPAALQAFMGNLPNSALRLVDPDIHLLQDGGLVDENGDLKRGPQSWAYLTAGQPPAPDPDWIREVLKAELSSGATVLLSPTGWIDAINPTRSMPAFMNWVDATRQIAGEAPMFVSATLESSWLTSANLRNQLLNEIVESEERLWYVRVRWPLLPDGYTQLADQAVLNGYKNLVTLAAAEQKVLVLPQSDLTGWAMSGLGAAAFSTGQSATTRNFSVQRRFGSQPNQPRPPARLRYFERPILATVEHEEHVSLAGDSNYTPCPCGYCSTIGAGTPSAAAWNKHQEHLHYLLRCARLQELTWDANRRVAVMNRVRQARRDAQSALHAARLSSEPAHLPLWEELLL